MLTAEDLIPVRALNQVSYCPRLYYLEYVESVMPTNEYVEDGIFLHRRVDDAGLQNRTRKEGDRLHTRSVSLSSERPGITAKLDLLEERAGVARPVEYKRSEAPTGPDGRPGVYDNDAIQLCAQGLLLEEEFGVSVTSGVLYYIGSKTRVDVPSTTPSAPGRSTPSGSSASFPRGRPPRLRCPPNCDIDASAARSPPSACPRRRST
jgi:CRISPR-associated protein Cas1